MRDFTFTEWVDWLWRVGIVQFTAFIFFILSLVSLSLPLAGEIRPYFILIIIYYWSINRPSILPPVFVLIFGLLYDLILGFPMGLHSVLFLITQLIVKNQRLFFMGQPYVIVWLSFAFTCFSVLLLESLFFSALNYQWINIEPIISSFFITVFSFPLFTLILVFMQRILPPIAKSSF